MLLSQDGRSSALTAPNGPAQQSVMRSALATAGIKPEDVAGLQLHGTGTSLGDSLGECWFLVGHEGGGCDCMQQCVLRDQIRSAYLCVLLCALLHGLS